MQNRVIVFHDDRSCTRRVSALLSELDYKCAAPATTAQLRLALKTPCHAAVVNWQAYAQEQSEICALLEEAGVPLVIAVAGNDAVDGDASAADRQGPNLHTLRLSELNRDRLAECFATRPAKTVDARTQPTTEVIAQLPAITSPKLKIIQSMLHEVVGETTPDATMIFSHTLPSRSDGGREGVLTDPRIAKLPAMILQGQSLAALAACHEIEESPARGVTGVVSLSNVSELRRCLEQELLETDIEFVADDLRLQPISSRSVLIGRPSKERKADISINCRWFSRADKSLSLSSDGTEWHVEDLGSANGSFVGEKRLQRNSRHMLPLGQTTIEIGRSFDRRSPVILHFNRAAPDVVVVSVSVGAAFDKAGWQTWPTLQEDLGKRWVVFRDEFVLGSDYAHKALGLPVQAKPAAVTFRNGFWVAPFEGGEVRLDDVSFRSAVPLPGSTDLCIGTMKLRIERSLQNTAEAAATPHDIQAKNGTQT